MIQLLHYLSNKIIYPPNLKGADLYYWPVPKNASTSFKKAVYEYNFNQPFQAPIYFGKKVSVHAFFPAKTNKYVHIKPSMKNFCIVRDPVSRFISLYTNKVLFRKDLEKYKSEFENISLSVTPNINIFTKYFEDYMRVSPTIRMHAIPQWQYLGLNPELFWKIYSLKKIDNLIEDIQSQIGNIFQSIIFKKGALIKGKW
jgi:hypothetical protein